MQTNIIVCIFVSLNLIFIKQLKIFKMSSTRTAAIKVVLEKAKAEGCVRFPESKGYRGPGLSVFERVQEWLASNGAKDADGNTPKLTKTALKQLLLTDDFKSMRFTGNVAGEKKTRTSKAGFSLLGFISGDGGESVAENVSASPMVNQTAPTEVLQEEVANSNGADQDDIFG